MIDLEKFCAAAEAHGAANNDLEYELGDLVALIRAMARILTPGQHEALLAAPEIRELAEVPEFADLLALTEQSSG